MRRSIRHSASRKACSRADSQGMQTRLRGHTSGSIVTILNYQQRGKTCRLQFNAGVKSINRLQATAMMHINTTIIRILRLLFEIFNASVRQCDGNVLSVFGHGASNRRVEILFLVINSIFQHGLIICVRDNFKRRFYPAQE